jgi:hypothetical protein
MTKRPWSAPDSDVNEFVASAKGESRQLHIRPQPRQLGRQDWTISVSLHALDCLGRQRPLQHRLPDGRAQL